MSPLTRLTNIQLSLIHVNDVPILDTLMSFAYVRRHASFPLASHLAVSSNAVKSVVRFNRVRIELFYHYSLKRTHNLGLEGGLNFRWICIPSLCSKLSRNFRWNLAWLTLNHFSQYPLFNSYEFPGMRHFLLTLLFPATQLE